VRASNAKCWLTVLGALCLAIAGEARADDSLWSFSLTRGPGAESCPEDAALTAEAEAIAGRTVFGESNRRIEGAIERTESGHAAVLRVFAVDGAELGERAFSSEGESCDELGHAIALGLALIADGGLEPPVEAPIEEPAVEEPRPPIERPDPEPASRLSAPDLSRIVPSDERGPSLALSGGAVLGQLPRVALSLGLHGRVMLARRISAEAMIAAALPAGAEVAPDASAEFWSIELALAFCPYDDRAGGVSFAVCGGLAGGVIVSNAIGFPIAEDEIGFHGGPLAGLRLSVGVAESLAAELLATVEVDLVGTDFVLRRGTAIEPVYEVFPVLARLAVGLAIDLGSLGD
jgi:hypothetical protein